MKKTINRVLYLDPNSQTNYVITEVVYQYSKVWVIIGGGQVSLEHLGTLDKKAKIQVTAAIIETYPEIIV
jgi:hypothetical protein